MAETLGVALVGCGTVGTGVARVLLEQPARLTERCGKVLNLKRIIVRDARKPRDAAIPPELITTDPSAILNDPSIHLVVELIGGTTTAKSVILAALEAGKDVVTANKALLADAGQQIFDAARRAGKTVCFEGAVAGGVPIIKALGESLAANQVTAIQAILNGTSNFILSSMADKGLSYQQALAEAQHLGYAEADPTLDIDGSDAAHKLAILAQIAFGVTATPEEIDRVGIHHVEAEDIRFAGELGYVIKLLAEAWVLERRVALHVAPVMVRKTDMLGQVRGPYNAVQIVGDLVGETLYQGPGAGMMATASAVVADLIDLASGRAQSTFQVAQLWSNRDRGYLIEPTEKVRSRFYLRLSVHDEAGALADVCRALANEGISISSVIQHEAQEGVPDQSIPLVIMTHYAETGRFRSALKEIRTLKCVRAEPVSYPVDD
jgi:homoserine dehydrogenase